MAKPEAAMNGISKKSAPQFKVEVSFENKILLFFAKNQTFAFVFCSWYIPARYETVPNTSDTKPKLN